MGKIRNNRKRQYWNDARNMFPSRLNIRYNAFKNNLLASTTIPLAHMSNRSTAQVGG